MQSTTKAVYASIIAWLKDGQQFTADVKDYAEAVLGVCTLSELEPLLAESDNPDIEPFVELILFPDDTLRHRLESILTQPLQDEEAEQLTEHLALASPSLVLHSDEKTLSLTVPEWMWGDVVTRLCLKDSTVASLLHSAPQIGTSLSIPTRSYLRTAKIPTSTAAHEALIQFFTTTLPHDPLFHPMLSTWVSVLTSVSPTCGYDEKELMEHLEKFRRRLYKAIFDATEFTRKLQRFNMETLMLSGDVPPAININEARLQIRLIDRLSIALFAKDVGAIEELEDRAWGDYRDYREHTLMLPVDM